LKALWRALKELAWAPLALLVFLEEWGWRPLSRWIAGWAWWPPIARLEARLRRLPPPIALLLFVVPALALLPVKLLALALMHRGHAVLGLTVIVAAKLLGTALLGRLFVLTETQLRHYAWLARALDGWARYKLRLRTWLRASAAGRASAAIAARVRAWLAPRRTDG